MASPSCLCSYSAWAPCVSTLPDALLAWCGSTAFVFREGCGRKTVDCLNPLAEHWAIEFDAATGEVLGAQYGSDIPTGSCPETWLYQWGEVQLGYGADCPEQRSCDIRENPEVVTTGACP